MAFSFYGKFFASAMNKEVDFNSDAIKGALVTSAYVFDHDAHQYFSSITNEVVGTGYTAGGAAVATPAFAYVAANSWTVSRANSTGYATGDPVRPATGNGYIYQALTAGTSGASIPTFPTVVGGTVTDGTVTWLCVAKGGLLLTGGNLSWTASTITARGLVLYDSTPGTAATNPLIGFADFGVDISTSGTTFAVNWQALGIAAILVP